MSMKSTLVLIGLRVWGFSTHRRMPEHQQSAYWFKFWCIRNMCTQVLHKRNIGRRTNGDFTKNEQRAINGSKVEQAWGKPIQYLTGLRSACQVPGVCWSTWRTKHLSFFHHYQGSIDFNIVNIHPTAEVYFFVPTGNRDDIEWNDQQRS